MIEDAELLRRYAADRSEPAFAELVQRHVNVVYAAALRRVGGDAHLAEEISQTVFTTLARKAGSLAGHPVLIGWLHRSTHYAAVDALREKLRRESRDQPLETMNAQADTNPNRGAEVDWEEIRPVVDSLLDQLNERDRGALLLRFFEGRSFSQIGATLRLTDDAARMRVERALDKLRTALGRRGITSTTAALGLALANQAAATAPAGIAASVTGAALAGAGSAGGAVGLLTFMSTTKIVSSVAVAVALLAVFSSVRESEKARESVTALNSVTGERDNLRAQMQALKKRAQQSDDSATAARRELAELRESASTSSDGSAKRAAAWQSTSPVNNALDHPAARAAFVEQEVSRAKAKFERFFKLTGLSAVEQERFLAVLKDFAEAKLDLTASVRAQGYGPNNVPQDPQALTMLFKVDSQVDAEFMGNLRTLLGDERYKQFYTYWRTMPEINVTDQLASQLYDSETPLTSDQARQLVQVLQQNRFDRKATPSPANTLSGTFISDEARVAALKQSNLVYGDIMLPGIDWPAPVTDAAIARAETVLAPAQLAALRRMQVQQAAQILLAPPPAPKK